MKQKMVKNRIDSVNLRPIKDLIKMKARPDTTLSLKDAMTKPEDIVSTYVFTPHLRAHTESIFNQISAGIGQGYWVQAEYGVGKTHFLAFISSLLTSEKDLWDKVSNEDIRIHKKSLKKIKLFPVILSLRGKKSQVEFQNESLLRILEKQIIQQLKRMGLDGKVRVTTEEQLFNWYQENKKYIESGFKVFLKEKYPDAFEGSVGDFIEEQGESGFADELMEYIRETKQNPDIPVNTEEKITYIYNQIIKQGFQGILFLIDEFSFWQDYSQRGNELKADDEEVLETLAWVLPKDNKLSIYTIVSSHKEIPTKFRGTRGGDRFIPIPLLADKNRTDYDIIVSQRIRELNENRMPEIKDYMDFYSNHFGFAKEVSKEYFSNIFPFQPWCFELIGRITRSESLEGTRLGIHVFYDALDNMDINRRKSLVTASDILEKSPSLYRAIESVHREKYKILQSIRREIPNLEELDEKEKVFAERIVETLFLIHLTYGDIKKTISAQELADATLTLDEDGVFKNNKDQTLLILDALKKFPQVVFESEDSISFDMKGTEFTSFFAELNNRKKKKENSDLSAKWGELLTEDTGTKQPMFLNGLDPNGTSKVQRVEFKKVSYPGLVVFDKNFVVGFPEDLQSVDDRYFKIIFLGVHNDKPLKLDDNRIAYINPSEITDEAKADLLEYMVLKEMEKDYQDKTGSDALKMREQINKYLYGDEGKENGVIHKMFEHQVNLYKTGTIVNKDEIGELDARTIFNQKDVNKVVEKIGEILLSNAYLSVRPLNDRGLKKVYKDQDSRKIFDGLIRRDTSDASARDACDNFAPGLWLSQLSNPREFKPDVNKVFDIIENLIQEGRGSVRRYQIYSLLSHKYGIPHSMIDLYLLSFVYAGKGEIHLIPGHKLHLKDGTAPRNNTITSQDVDRLEWDSKFYKYFDTLTRPTEIQWNIVVDFARVFSPNLKAVSGQPDEIKNQESRLTDSLGHHLQQINATTKNLSSLCKALGEKEKDVYFSPLKSLKNITESKDYKTFYQKVEDEFDKDVDKLSEAYNFFKKLNSISDKVTGLIADITYLKSSTLPEGELSNLKDEIERQLRIDNLIQDSFAVSNLESRLGEFKQKYINEYQKHHRDVNCERQRGLELLQSVRQALNGYSLLADIPELNISRVRWEKHLISFQQKLSLCPDEPWVNVDVSSFSVCRSCGITLKTLLGIKDVEEFKETFFSHVKDTLSRLKKLLEPLVNRNDYEDLFNLEDPEDVQILFDNDKVDEINLILEEARIKTESVSFSDIKQDLPPLSRDNLDSFMKKLKFTLQKRIEDAEKSNPGKKVILVIGR